MGDLSDFERGQILGARLAGTFVTKTATLLGVSRATVSEVMSAYTNHGKTIQRRGTVGENQHWQKETAVQ
jgi:predicted transcriptional regulator